MMKIGITDNYTSEKKLSYYSDWIQRTNPQTEIVKLSYTLGNAALIEQMNGLVMVGGGDVNPSLYGKGGEITRCEGVDDRRDEFEFDVIKRALNARLPILAICRGMQIMNVYLGGSLILDLPSAGYNNHASKDGKDGMHQTSTVPGSLFREIIGKVELTINSSHHQAIDRLGKGLVAGAISPDSVVEAVEWEDKQSSPFLLMVQYHPERMNDNNNPASRNIAERFLSKVQQSINKNRVNSHYIRKKTE